MRWHATKKGYHLSDKGMWPSVRRGLDSIPAGPPIHVDSEKEIFDILGIKYMYVYPSSTRNIPLAVPLLRGSLATSPNCFCHQRGEKLGAGCLLQHLTERHYVQSN
eukprot:Blabericola_migrator_1__11431@NODE_679_length_6909_cov_149_679480_g493_i0_p8_GENE_NODE_679_length_6909_cov_149_679480_g493_i0NODE_679_length_6909_cov_149_679480_g493_i0_p8_ORF_typecomplete_len106_score8_83DNA_pol_B_thumb/PF14791_6/1_1e08_NODE_679_length_6909_cov_149_679480_g493_i0630947